MGRALACLALWGVAACALGDPDGLPVSLPDPVSAPAPPTPEACGVDVAHQVATQEHKSPAAVAPSKGLVETRQILETVVHEHARDPKNPWAIGHAILALGPEVVLDNDVPAVEWLFTQYADRTESGVRFPRSVGSIRVEPHTDLVLKALTESGLGPEVAVLVDGEEVHLSDLYRGSLCRSFVDGHRMSFDDHNDMPWALQGLSAWAPSGLSWSSDGGYSMTLDGLTSVAVQKLRSETEFMREAMAKGTTVQKRKQGIFAYTCGGAHLLQGAAYAVARGFGTDEDREAIAAEVPVLFWRVDIELSAVDTALQQRPEYAVILLEQRMKFLGHFLETAHKLAAMGLYEPDASQQAALNRAVEELVRTVQVLQQNHVFERLETLRTTHEQVYLDFVGDAAHAIRGLDLATGVGSVRL